MNYRPLGKTGLSVSQISFGASSLGGVFHEVHEDEAIRAVHVALDAGINYIDVAPAYGATRAETVLGMALKGVPRDRYYLSTKVGKYTDPSAYGVDTFDYSNDTIRRSLDESAERIGVEYFDIVHLHDIEYDNGAHTERALDEGVRTLQALKAEGRIGAVSIGTYPLPLWRRVLEEVEIDAALVHNHYCLNDTRMLELIPLAQAKGIGLINASPFACGLLTRRGAPAWHPLTAEQRSVFARAAAHCANKGEDIARIALQFACQNPRIPTTLFSSAHPDSVRRNVAWIAEPINEQLCREVQDILAPVVDRDWNFT